MPIHSLKDILKDEKKEALDVRTDKDYLSIKSTSL